MSISPIPLSAARTIAANSISTASGTSLRKGDLDVVAKWQTRPNGITLSADGKLLYVTDSDRHAVVAFDLDRTGSAGNPRDVIKNIAGVPGGIRTDVDGRFYVAAKGVAVYTAEGKLATDAARKREYIELRVWRGRSGIAVHRRARTMSIRVKLGVKGALQY